MSHNTLRFVWLDVKDADSYGNVLLSLYRFIGDFTFLLIYSTFLRVLIIKFHGFRLQ